MAGRKLERPSKARLAKLCAAYPMTEVAAMLDCHRGTARAWADQYGITDLYRSKFDIPSGDVLRQLSENYTDAQLAKRFRCAEITIRSRRHADGIFRSRVRRRYSLDEAFFEKIDTEHKAYILGFLAADGTVTAHRRAVVLMLHSKDVHILRDIRAAMGSNARIFKREKIAGFPNRGPYNFIYFGSQKLVAGLARHGVGPRKSLTLEYPTGLPRNMERHFLRGLLDGDGTVREQSFKFLGTEMVIDDLIDVVERHTGIRLSKGRADKLWVAVGCKRSKAVIHWLYKDATIFLRRKHRRFMSHWQ